MLAFDRKASTYHDNSHVQHDSANWVAEWLPDASLTGRCLEFGAGSGNLTASLVSRFSHVQATDIAPAMVTEGHNRYPSAQWSVCDAWNPPPLNGPAWDLVASSSMLQWAPEPQQVLQRWADLLHPQGRILCGIYVRPSLPELGSLLPANRQFRWLDPTDWVSAFADAGMQVLRHETLTRKYIYPSPLKLMRRLHNTGVALSDPSLAVGAMKSILRQYVQQFSHPDGVRATWSTLRIEAQR